MDQARRDTLAKQVREFAAGSESEYVFPPDLSVEERKVVKSMAQKLGLQTQSFGMGDQRQIHVFPPLKPTHPSTFSEVKYSLKNTFVDWAADTQEDLVGPSALSLPAGLFQVHLAEPDDADEKLGSMNVSSGGGVIALPAVDSLLSTDAEPSDTESMESSDSDRDSVPVKNTFVHFAEASAHDDVDPRIIQSMPAGKFAEALEKDLDTSLQQGHGNAMVRRLNILVDDLGAPGSKDSEHELQSVFPSTPDAVTAGGTSMPVISAQVPEEKEMRGTEPAAILLPGAMWASTGLPSQPASAVPLHGGLYAGVSVNGRVTCASTDADLAVALPCLTPGSGVIICNLERQPTFNGRRGTVHSFDSDNGRYNVFLDSTEHCAQRSAKIKPENLILAAPIPSQGSREIGKAMLVLDQLIT